MEQKRIESNHSTNTTFRQLPAAYVNVLAISFRSPSKSLRDPEDTNESGYQTIFIQKPLSNEQNTGTNLIIEVLNNLEALNSEKCSEFLNDRSCLQSYFSPNLSIQAEHYFSEKAKGLSNNHEESTRMVHKNVLNCLKSHFYTQFVIFQLIFDLVYEN